MSLMYDALRSGSDDLAAQYNSRTQGATGVSQRVPAVVVIPRKLLIYGGLVLLLLSAVTSAISMYGLGDKKAGLTAQGAPAQTAAKATETVATNARIMVDTAQNKPEVEVSNANGMPTAPVTRLSNSLPSQPVAAIQATVVDNSRLTAESSRSVPMPSPATPKQAMAVAMPRVTAFPAASPVKSPAADAKAVQALTPAVAVAAVPVPAQTVKAEPTTQVTPTTPVPQVVQTAAMAPAGSKAAGPVEVTPLSSRAANQVPAAVQPLDDSISLAERFDLMNRDLTKADKSDAAMHLRAIQSALPSSSIARLRAEGWHEYQTGNLEAARKTYRKLLDRVPADEQAKSALQALSAAGNMAAGLK